MASELIQPVTNKWKTKRLKFCLQSPLKYGANEPGESSDPEEPRFIRITDLAENGKLRADTFRSLEYEKARDFLLEDGDILLARSGATVGKTFMYKKEWGASCYAGYLIRARLNKAILLPSYASYFLSSTAYWEWVRSIYIQATIQNVSAEKYANLDVPIPPITEQQSIANFLDQKTKQIDDLIEQKEKLLALLYEKRTAIITQTVTKGLDPKAKMKDSGIQWLGEVPEDWTCSKLRFTTSYIGSGKTPKGGSQVYLDEGIMLLRSQNIHDDGLRLDDVVFINEEMDNELRNSRIQPFDVLLNITGASLGRSFFIPAQFPAANVNQHVCIIRARMDLVHFRFLHFFLVSTIGKSQVESYENGSSREGLNFQQIANMFICLPSKDDQLRIVNYLSGYISKIDDTIKNIENSVSHLNEYRSSLINSAVTGKIDVRKEKVA